MSTKDPSKKIIVGSICPQPPDKFALDKGTRLHQAMELLGEDFPQFKEAMKRILPLAGEEQQIVLTIVTSGDRSVGIWEDEVIVSFSPWIKEYLDDKESADERGRTWRTQLEEDLITLLAPYYDGLLHGYWSDQEEPPFGE
jgi:hypothetical protein